MPSGERPRAIVLDTSAVLAGMLDVPLEPTPCMTTLVLNEVRAKASRSTVDVGLGTLHRVSVMDPPPAAVEEVRKKAAELGEALRLSEADMSILALGAELRRTRGSPVEIFSDDYSLENTASHMGLSFRSLSSRGITHVMEWRYFCRGCRREYRNVPRGGICEICGSEIRRRPTSKKAHARTQQPPE
ncbi:MAG: hypothetical protein JRN39_02315 [Nitrososphaerota archaeon]|nr:hypothetical protein [Nitrososphaerota archaeon]MDG6939220.1 hypothetical protein [Nitrososphaerota archaeon]